MDLVGSAKHVLVGTGATWVLWLLIFLSVLSIAVILERAYIFWAHGGDLDELRSLLMDSLRKGGFEQARDAMKKSSHPAAAVVLRGMRREESETSPEEASEAMAAETIVQRGALEARLNYLGTLGANAPFIGLFGTVIGILQSFDELGKNATQAAQASQAAAQAASAPQAVMSNLAEALVATAVGIFVAIPAVFAFNYFQRAVKVRLNDVEVLSRELLAFLHSDKGAPAPKTAE